MKEIFKPVKVLPGDKDKMILVNLSLLDLKQLNNIIILMNEQFQKEEKTKGLAVRTLTIINLWQNIRKTISDNEKQNEQVNH